MINQMPQTPFDTWDAPRKLQGLSEEELTTLFNHFVDWTQRVQKWQLQVTHDIHELKAAKGNPDDPPPPPWKPKP